MKIALRLVLVSLFAIGCQTTAPTFEPLPADDSRADALIAALTERAMARQALRAAVRVALDAPDLRFRRPERIAVRRPAHIRVEVLGLFGQIAAVLVSDGVRYQRLGAGGEGFESGPVYEDLLWQVARIRLTPHEAVELLLGAPVPTPGFEREGVYATGEGRIAIEYRRAGASTHRHSRERFEFDRAGDLRVLTHWYESGEPAWVADFNDYREVSGSPFAFEVRFDFPGVGARAKLNFDDVVFNADLPDELFELRRPREISLVAGAEDATPQ